MKSRTNQIFSPRNQWASWVVLVTVFALGCIENPQPPTSDSKGTDKSKKKYVLHTKFEKGTPADEGFVERALANPFDPITEVEFSKPNEVDPSLVADDDLVLGVKIGEQSRAYPITQLCGPQREIINDELAGKYIAATW